MTNSHVTSLANLRAAACILALALCLNGCANLVRPADYAAKDAELCRDLALLPQDLNVYAGAEGHPLPPDGVSPDTPILSVKRQNASRERALARFYAPWAQAKAANKLEEAMWGLFSLKPERGYAENLRPYPPERWEELRENCAPAGYPNSAVKAITLRRADLRLLPTHSPYFFNPARPGQGYPFDYYQNSSLPPGSPVFISHLSKDGRWALVESASAGGWVDLADLAQVDSRFITDWQSAPLAAITHDETILRPAAKNRPGKIPPLALEANIGALLPKANTPSNGKIALLVPERGSDGFARPAPYLVDSLQAESWTEPGAEPWPLPLNRRKLAELGNRLLGQPYGWGGYGGNRDCSAMTRDLLLPFGLWLPRNSGGQAGIGRQTDLSALEPAAREKTILREAKPFITLINMPGHVGLYLGQYQGRAVMLHNVWGLRTFRPATLLTDKQEGRAIIGKAVITTLTPGEERRDIGSPNSLLDRVKSFNVIAVE